MNPIIVSVLATLSLFAAMLLFLELGRRIGLRRLREDPQGTTNGVGTIDTAVFALLGLFLAFTFSDASRRFDERRRQIVEESNDIGTAWLRLDLTPPDAQPALRDAFRRYVDARIDLYRADSSESIDDRLARSTALQGDIWGLAVAACSRPEGERARMLVLPALNEMIDITSVRLAMIRMHSPALVFAMLVLLSLAVSLFVGIEMAGSIGRRWVHRIGFAALISATIYLIAEIEFPRRGLVRIDTFDQMLVDLRRSLD
jgi:hypothetical protein